MLIHGIGGLVHRIEGELALKIAVLQSYGEDGQGFGIGGDHRIHNKAAGQGQTHDRSAGGIVYRDGTLIAVLLGCDRRIARRIDGG